MVDFATMTRPANPPSILMKLLHKRQEQINNLEAQVQALMKQRQLLREMVSEQREFLDKVAACDDVELAVQADLLLTEAPI